MKIAYIVILAILGFIFTPLVSATTFTPESVTATLNPGESIDENKISVTDPTPLSKADIVFSFDLTGSMDGTINTAKSNAIDIMNAVQSEVPDSQFAVVSYMDYPNYYNSFGYSSTYGSSYGDYAYKLSQPITSDKDQVQTAINSLVLGSGADGPQDYTRAFYESYADPSIDYRTGSKKILVNFGDNVPHDNDLNEGIPGKTGTYSTGGDPGRNEVMDETSDPSKIGVDNDDLDLQKVLLEMKSNGVTLLEVHASPYQTDYWNYWTGTTGGNVYVISSSSPEEITNAIVSLVEETISSIDSLTLRAEPGYESWISWTPVEYTNVGGSETRDFNVKITVPAGTAPGTYNFKIYLTGDGADLASQDVSITVPSTIVPPVANAGPEQVVEQTNPTGASITLDGSGSTYDGPMEKLTYTWTWNGGSAEGMDPVVTLPAGTTTVTLTVSDGELSDTDTVDITVQDTTKPEITVSGKLIVLWPPNHKYQTVSLSDCGISITDVCDTDVSVENIIITSVSSDEPEDALGDGDGKTMADIVIKGPQTVDLRAERQGDGNGRVYTINFEVADKSGNIAEGSCQVWVPHDQDTGATAVDDGVAAGYTVFSE